MGNLSIDAPSSFAKHFFISEVLAILALCLSKCSTTTLILRVFTVDRGNAWVAGWSLMGLNIVWGIASITGLNVQCQSLQLFVKTDMNDCPKQVGSNSMWLMDSTPRV